MTKLLLNQCTNIPFGANSLKNLPNLPNLVVLVDGAVYNQKCPNSAVLNPCTCAVPTGAPEVTINCPPGTTIQQIKTAFQNLPANSNIGNVILSFPTGATTVILAEILGNNKASTIQIIGPTQPTLSKLTVCYKIGVNLINLIRSSLLFDSQIDSKAFSTSASTATSFIIEQFDVGNLNCQFLKEFNILTKIILNKCTNTPTAENGPNGLPRLPKLNSVLIDDVIFKIQCPSAAQFAPCLCTVKPGDNPDISCPAGATIPEIKAIFTNLPAISKVGIAQIDFPATATTFIPESFLGNIEFGLIHLRGSSPAGGKLSELTV